MRKQTSKKRFWRHLMADHHRSRRAFPKSALARIEHAIAEGEARHRGQVRFVVEASLPLSRVLRRVTAGSRALELFGLLRVWDTEENCGVLVYLLLADQAVEIVADRGIHARVDEGAWRAICAKMETAFRARHYIDGALTGVGEISALLARNFPADGPTANELPDRPLVI